MKTTRMDWIHTYTTCNCEPPRCERPIPWTSKKLIRGIMKLQAQVTGRNNKDTGDVHAADEMSLSPVGDNRPGWFPYFGPRT